MSQFVTYVDNLDNLETQGHTGNMRNQVALKTIFISLYGSSRIPEIPHQEISIVFKAT